MTGSPLKIFVTDNIKDILMQLYNEPIDEKEKEILKAQLAVLQQVDKICTERGRY